MTEAEGYAALERGDLAGAEWIFEVLRASDPVASAFGLGYVYSRSRRFEAAREAYRVILEQARIQQNATLEHMAVHQLGMLEREAGELEAALALFERERELISALGNPPLAVSVNAYELGYVRLKLGDLKVSDPWLSLCLETARQSGNLTALACAHRARGEWQLARKDRDLAVIELHEAARLFREQGEGDERAAAEALALLA